MFVSSNTEASIFKKTHTRKLATAIVEWMIIESSPHWEFVSLPLRFF